MSKLNHLYRAEKILFFNKHIRNGGYCIEWLSALVEGTILTQYVSTQEKCLNDCTFRKMCKSDFRSIVFIQCENVVVAFSAECPKFCQYILIKDKILKVF